MEAQNDLSAPSLAQIEARLARFEQSLTRVEQVATQGQAMVAVASDVIDQATPGGISLDQRLATLTELLERGTRPQAAKALAHMAAQAPAIPHGVATVIDILDDHIAKHPELPQRLEALLALAAQASAPENAKALTIVLDQLIQAPALVSTLADILDSFVSKEPQGSSLDNVVQNLSTLVSWLAQDSTKTLLACIPADAESVNALSLLAHSASNSAKSTPSQVGLWGALSKLRSDDARYALGFACEFLEQLGRSLKTNGARS